MRPIIIITKQYIEVKGGLPLSVHDLSLPVKARARELDSISNIYQLTAREAVILVYSYDLSSPYNYAIKLFNKDGEIKSINNLVKLLKFSTHYELYIDMENMQPIGIIKDIIHIKDNTITTTVYKDNAYRIVFFSDTTLYEKTMPPIDKLDITSLNIGEQIVIVIKGEIIENNKDFLLIVSYREDVFLELNYIIAHRISIEEDSIVVQDKLNDMLKRTITTKYVLNGSGLETQDRAIDYHLSDSNYIKSMTPYLFLEAVMAEDMEKAAGYLSYDLKDDFNKITDFIGKFSDIKSESLNKIAVYDINCNPVNIRLLSFDLRDGYIDNIELVE